MALPKFCQGSLIISVCSESVHFRTDQLITPFTMQASQRKGVESVDTQSLFDQMYAVQLNSKGEPFVSGENIEEYVPDPTYQVDPTDAVMILKGPLLEAAASGGDTWTESERIVIADCIQRLEQCEKLIESTTIGKSDPVRRFTKEDFAFVNKFVSDSESVLKVDFTNDQTWGNNLPSALLLKDIMGGLPLSDIGDEKFMVRGKSYLVDNKKVRNCSVFFFFVRICTQHFLSCSQTIVVFSFVC